MRRGICGSRQIEHEGRRTTLIWLLEVISVVAYAPVALWVALHGSWQLTPAALPWILGSGRHPRRLLLALLGGYRASDLSVVYPTARAPAR
jgi:hypothetical protein